MGLSLTVSALWTQNHFVTTVRRARSGKGNAVDGVTLKINSSRSTLTCPNASGFMYFAVYLNVHTNCKIDYDDTCRVTVKAAVYS